jgi:hypothetical protein
MSTCPSCKYFGSTKSALAQHYLAKHSLYLCPECNKTFVSSRALEQHSSSQHGQTNPTSKGSGRNNGHDHDDPYPGIEGYWIPRQRFRTTKSFGSYQCHCGNDWFSAHAHKNYRQGCQSCEDESYPCCMWVNTESDNREKRSWEEDDKPHDRARCEACRRGECLQY